MSETSENRKPTVEETLQNIDSTLKRIEELLGNKSDVTVITSRIMGGMTEALEKTQKELSKSGPKHHWD